MIEVMTHELFLHGTKFLLKKKTRITYINICSIFMEDNKIYAMMVKRNKFILIWLKFMYHELSFVYHETSFLSSEIDI